MFKFTRLAIRLAIISLQPSFATLAGLARFYSYFNINMSVRINAERLIEIFHFSSYHTILTTFSE